MRKLFVMKFKNEFTLLELLIVITIIGILTSLLLPNLANARRQAQSTVCKNNLRTFHIAYNNVLEVGRDEPVSLDPVTGLDNNAYKDAPPGAILDSHGIVRVLTKELKSMGTDAIKVGCPTGALRENWRVDTAGRAFPRTWFYGYNGRYSWNSNSPKRYIFVSGLKSPSTLILMADKKDDKYQIGATQTLHELHLAQRLKANCIAYDGHVETTSQLRATSKDFGDATFARYFNGNNP